MNKDAHFLLNLPCSVFKSARVTTIDLLNGRHNRTHQMLGGGCFLMELIEKWKTQDAVETYGIRHWGKGYFGINKDGHVTVHPNKMPEQAIDLKELVDQLQARGIQLPILLRFTDILRH